MIPERFAANVAWLFTDRPWLDRFDAARAAGFASVEFPWPDDPASTAAAVRSAGLRVVMLNAPAGDLGAGERGFPNDPGRVDEWRDGFRSALRLCRETGCPTVNVLAGNRIGGDAPDGQLACLEDNLRWAVESAAPEGVTVVTEVLNPLEQPDYLVLSLDDAAVLLDRLAPIGWKLQLDTYHLGRAGGDVAAEIRRAAGAIGHLQVADVPGRHEPGTGSLDWVAIAAALRAAGYRGAIGLEYRPTSDLSWIAGTAL